MKANIQAKQQRRKRSTLLVSVALLAAALGVSALVVSWVPGQDSTVAVASPIKTPDPPTATIPVETTTAVPTQPADSIRALPTDCRAIYTPSFLDEYANVELNMPEVMAMESRVSPMSKRSGRDCPVLSATGAGRPKVDCRRQ